MRNNKKKLNWFLKELTSPNIDKTQSVLEHKKWPLFETKLTEMDKKIKNFIFFLGNDGQREKRRTSSNAGKILEKKTQRCNLLMFL